MGCRVYWAVVPGCLSHRRLKHFASTIIAGLMLLNTVAAIAAPPPPPPINFEYIKGYIDRVSGATVSGWACAVYHSGSISAHIYVGGQAGSGQYLTAISASNASETAVANACLSSGRNYRFSYTFTSSQRIIHGGKKIYIHGINPFGNGNLLITRSGTFSVPALPPLAPASISAPTSTDKDGSYTVSWAGSTAATYYLLQESKNGGGYVTKYYSSGKAKYFSGQSNATYRYRVRASNSNGSSGWRYSSTFTVLRAPPVPSSISTPTGTDTDGAFTVSWAGASTATAYLLQESRNGGAYATKYSGSGRSKAFSGQTNATYRYRVRASNSSGSSGWRY